MPFYVRFNIRKPTVKARTDGEAPSSRSPVMWVAQPSSAVHFETSYERLLMGMDKALKRKRRTEAGEQVTRDAMEWWRCHSREDAKLVVCPLEKGQEERRPHPHPAPAPAPAPVIATTSTERARKQTDTCIKKPLTWALLLSLLVVNLMALNAIVYVAMDWKE